MRSRCSALAPQKRVAGGYLVGLWELGGRVDRGADRGNDCRVLDFEFADRQTFPDNPRLKSAKAALDFLFDNGDIGSDKPCDLKTVCLKAMKAEFQVAQQFGALEKVQAEKAMDYPKVAEDCRVIQSDTRTVIIDPGIVARIRDSQKVSSLELLRHSVQMYPYKIAVNAIDPIFPDDDDLFCLPASWEYDPDFLGCMAHIVKQSSALMPGGIFI